MVCSCADLQVCVSVRSQYSEGSAAVSAGNAVRITSPAKTVADCFRYRNKIGLDVAFEALLDCYHQRRATLDEIWQAAKVCRVAHVIRPYMELLHLCYNVLMANTQSTTFSIRLKPEVKKRLGKLAKAAGRSSNFLISDAVESYVADQERMLADIRQADRQVKSGHHIRHEDMKAWLLSWGTDHELPPPKCVCGKEHHDEARCR